MSSPQKGCQTEFISPEGYPSVAGVNPEWSPSPNRLGSKWDLVIYNRALGQVVTPFICKDHPWQIPFPPILRLIIYFLSPVIPFLREHKPTGVSHCPKKFNSFIDINIYIVLQEVQAERNLIFRNFGALCSLLHSGLFWLDLMKKV